MKNILICCSSREEVNKDFLFLADTVSKEISSLGYRLIFGASSSGMMGRCMNNFDEVYSYTVEKYREDLENIPSTKEYIVETTFDRTKEMYKDSDIILVLPGGTGTIAEVFSILEENRSISTPKPMIIYNYNGYYDNVLNIINIAIDNNFNNSSIKNYYQVCDNLEDLIKNIKNTRDEA